MLDITDVSSTYGQIQPLLLKITFTNSESVAHNHFFT
ncbi:hypothetical protein T11_11278 [Trichinella zimbabwensis]|uniref:Uncharacterized protein n=1 Tax=Trichinella zimbabwensis TaxID=268475 RepID=A0A0V1F1V5_9BILA|nr:hypothetical protein T11_11278 [Trichinella zimbabwensis]